jgi:hypothetical protein
MGALRQAPYGRPNACTAVERPSDRTNAEPAHGRVQDEESRAATQQLFTQLAVACLGAGVVTTLAVAQGQNPLTALGITLFSAVAAVAVGQLI